MVEETQPGSSMRSKTSRTADPPHVSDLDKLSAPWRPTADNRERPRSSTGAPPSDATQFSAQNKPFIPATKPKQALDTDPPPKGYGKNGPGHKGAKGKGKVSKPGKLPKATDIFTRTSGKGVIYDAGKELKIAIVELFAGLRTSHLAAKQVKNLTVILAHAAEKCSFANSLAAKNNISEKVFTDVAHLDSKWAEDFVNEALSKGAKVILLTAGFPCKGLSRQRGKNRPNLRDRQSCLYTHIPRVEELLRKASNNRIRVHKIVENVVMQEAPKKEVSDVLSCKPVLVDARIRAGLPGLASFGPTSTSGRCTTSQSDQVVLTTSCSWQKIRLASSGWIQVGKTTLTSQVITRAWWAGNLSPNNQGIVEASPRHPAKPSSGGPTISGRRASLSIN